MEELVYESSNEIEILFTLLKERLCRCGTFSRRIILVPNQAIKSWIMWQLANDPSLSVATGLEFVFLPDLNQKLDTLFSEKTAIGHIPSQSDLFFRLHHEIRRLLSENEELATYLKVNQEDKNLSLRSEKRLIGLCEVLATQFSRYGLYGGEELLSWESKESKSWQEELWCRIFTGEGAWSTHAKELGQGDLVEEKEQDISLHIFAFNYISPPQLAYLQSLGNLVPVNFYVLSPCMAFWADLKTSRESRGLQRFWKNRGVSESSLDNLDELLRDTNAVLANFGKLGREFIGLLDDYSFAPEDHYHFPEWIRSVPEYADFLWDDFEAEAKEVLQPSILQALQADMLLLRNPEGSEPVPCLDLDKSFQLHQCPSKRREVEILYQQLLGLIGDFGSEGESVCPEDILVMAPRIQDYEPYIKATFGSSSSQIEYRVSDTTALENNSYVQGVMCLLNLVQSRWDVPSVLALFEHPYFCEKHQITSGDLEQYRRWVHETGIRWGEDNAHRQELLERDFCEHPMLEKGEVSTWSHGFKRLYAGLAMIEGEEGHCLPHVGVEFTQMEALGKLEFLLRSLREDLEVFERDKEWSLAEFLSYLDCILEAYFLVPHKDKEGAQFKEHLEEHFTSLRKAAKVVPEARLSFTTLYHCLNSLFSKSSERMQGTHVQAATFCSFAPMRAVPAKIICLLGMDEDHFPRHDKETGLDLIKGKQVYIPTKCDEDRYVFLEALLSCRKAFCIFYTRVSSESKDEVGPSLVVSELLTYLDKAFILGDGKVSEHCTYKHPSKEYDASYFMEGESRFSSYSSLHYRWALAASSKVEKRSEGVYPLEFKHRDPSLKSPSSSKEVVDIRSLTTAVRNPIESFYKERLGIYLNREELAYQEDGEFSFDPYLMAILRRSSLKSDIDQLLWSLEEAGQLPFGVFKDLARERIKAEVAEYKGFLQEQGVSSKDFYDLELSPQCVDAVQLSDDKWRVPSPSITLETEEGSREIFFKGTIRDCTPYGLVGVLKDSFTDILSLWPSQLLIRELRGISSKFNPNLILLKGKKQKAFDDEVFNGGLSSLFKFYEKNLSQCFPLLSEWYPDMCSEKPDLFSKRVLRSLKDERTIIYNPYFAKLFLGEQNIESDKIFSLCSDDVRNVVGKLHASFKKKGGD